ncbi:MAG: serine/threonine protein phosphatase [Symploca sp. SIO2E6]|nr:serine/threonine protein phosphatase [Symploca sp. SIO2E6]
MDNPTAMLHCPNTRCQAPNAQSNQFCEQCRTPLLKRYLWAIGKGIKAYEPGEIIAERYLLMHSSVILDMKPAIPPDTPQDIPQVLTPYLRLCPYGLHTPQLYGRLTPTKGRRHPEVWLLEKVPIRVIQMADAQGQLFPELTTAWKNASAMRQLNWLWQIGNLWQPLSSEGVASSLFIPEILRVEGSLVRLLRLQADTQGKPTLQQLGQLWSERLLVGISPIIADFFQQLCTQLIDGQLRTSEQLVDMIEQALKDCRRNQSCTSEIFASTDAGPSRHQNEDACYPPSEQLLSSTTGANLAIVCDGIGGHEGGEVASHLAIETLQEQLEQLPKDPEQIDQTSLTLGLELAVCTANDLISQQNDTERRSDRQRMGTTLVMAQSFGHQMYITHVGDSRVYWITRNNCHQVTLDDDLASREVRLGYALYRYAVQMPTSGSLVQALGMGSSNALHPTVQRLILDEDCVFLLCSDGLSDYDRVEQYWQTEILPILKGEIDLKRAGKRLIEIANTQNGHDNVTVALVHCQVRPLENWQTHLSVIQPAIVPTPSTTTLSTPIASAAPSQVKTQQLSNSPSRRRFWGLLGIVLLLLLGGGAAAYYWFRNQVAILGDQVGNNPPSPIPSDSNGIIPSPTATPSPNIPASIQPNDWIEIKDDIPLVVKNSQALTEEKLIPAGSILQVTEKLNLDEDIQWLQVKVCSVATNDSETQQTDSASNVPESPQNLPGEPKQTPQLNSEPQEKPQATLSQVIPGDIGRLLETKVKQGIRDNIMQFRPSNSKLSPAQLGECEPPATPPSPTPQKQPSPSPQSDGKNPSN